MSRKDIIIISVIVNAGLLVILLISALTTKESYLVSSSAQVANTILESDTNGMVPSKTEVAVADLKTEEVKKDEPLKVEGGETALKLDAAIKEDPIVHQLPSTDAIVAEASKPEFLEVVVKKGDTIDKIAKANHSSINQIIKTNELSNTFLRVGQKLRIPKGKTEKTETLTSLEEKKVDYYTVKVGDNPWTIAMKHHLKVDELLKMNKLNSKTAKKLRPGDKLRIR